MSTALSTARTTVQHFRLTAEWEQFHLKLLTFNEKQCLGRDDVNALFFFFFFEVSLQQTKLFLQVLGSGAQQS